jgi:hypothetical protein
MPRVETYNTPQVEQRALPGARQSSVASPALFGAAAEQQEQMGKSMLVAGTGVANAANVMQERENADMIFRAETTLKDDYLKYDRSARGRRGQQAWGVTAETEEWFGEQEKQHTKILENDKQRYLFKQSLTKLGERRRSIEESANASIVSSINTAAASAAEWYSTPPGETGSTPSQATVTTVGPDGTPEVAVKGVEVTARRDPITGIKSDILKRVQVLSQLNGWSPERKEYEEAKHVTNLHKQVLQVLADKDPSAAREYFDVNKAEINGSEHDNINKVLKIGETRGVAQAWVDKLDGAQEERFALEAARIEFKDKPEMRDAVITEVKIRFNEKRQLREGMQKDAADQAWKIASDAGMKAVPSHLIASMDGRDVENMRTHFSNKAAGVNVKTNPTVWLDVHDQILRGEKVDLRKHINDISDTDIKGLAKLQTDDVTRNDAATLTQQINHTWGRGPKEKKDPFAKAVNDAVNIEQTRLGKKLNYEERQKIIDKLYISGEVEKDWAIDPDKQYFETTSTEREKFVPTIPQAERDEIIELYKRQNKKEPTDEKVMELYRKWKGL